MATEVVYSRPAPDLVGKSWGIRLQTFAILNNRMHTSPPRFWDGVLRRLGAEMPSLALEAWIDPLIAHNAARPDGESQERLTLNCPTAFHRDRIRERFLTDIERCAAAEAGMPVAVDLVVASARGDVPHPAQTAPESAKDRENSPPAPCAPAAR